MKSGENMNKSQLLTKLFSRLNFETNEHDRLNLFVTQTFQQITLEFLSAILDDVADDSTIHSAI